MLILIALSGCSKKQVESDIPIEYNLQGEYDAFAKCLSEKKATIYGTEWCPHCKNQKELFGNSFQYIDYVDCDENGEACLAAGITGLPTWNINGQDYEGEQSLDVLALLTGCELVAKQIF